MRRKAFEMKCGPGFSSILYNTERRSIDDD
jgi:hypothetical protein